MATTRKKVHAARRTAVYIRDQATCQCCGYRPRRAVQAELMEIDHIVPCSRGGTSAMENLQVLCWRCNNRKGDMTMDEFEGVFWGKLGEINYAEFQRHGRCLTGASDQGWL